MTIRPALPNAACRGEDPELFFPLGQGLPSDQQIDAAKVVCRRCPEISDCLQWALEVSPVEGVWGGTAESERKALIYNRQRKRVS